MIGELATDTAVDREGPGRYAATVTDRWDVAAAPNGGYLMTIGLRALADVLPHPDPLTVTGHFLRPAPHGPVEVTTEVVRTGRTVATGQARLHHDGSPFLLVTAMFGELRDGQAAVRGQPPHLPPPEDCVASRGALPHGIRPTIVDRLDIRFPPGVPGWAYDGPSGVAELTGWFRFADGHAPDALAVPTVVDAFPPVVFELGLLGWVPTLELTAHLRRRPGAGWLRCRVGTRFLVGDLLEEDVEVWDEAGRFVAQSRQLALAPRAPG